MIALERTYWAKIIVANQTSLKIRDVLEYEMRYLYEMHKKRQLASENNNIAALSTMLWFHHIMTSLTFGPFLEMKGNNGREKSSTCKTIQKSRMKNCVFVHLKFSNIRDHDMNTYILNLPKQWLQIPKTTLPSQAVS